MNDSNQQSSTPVGRPIQAPRPSLAPDLRNESLPPQVTQDINSKQRLHEDSSRVSGRLDDTTIGRPIQVPKERVVTQLTLDQIGDANLGLERQTAIDAALEKPLEVPRFFTGTTSKLVVLVLTIVLGWFVVVQSILVLSALNGLPSIVRFIGYVLLGLLLAATFSPVWKFWTMYRVLRQNRQISMTRIRSTEKQGNNSEAACAASKGILMTYLKGMDIESDAGRALLKGLGMNADAISSLGSAKYSLLQDRLSSSAQWIKEFESHVLDRLDELAKTRVNSFAKSVGIKTAISPWRSLDFAIVIYHNFAMLNDLCKIYQVRASHLGTLYLFFFILFHAYLAGDILESVSSAAGEEATYLLNAVVGSAISHYAGMGAAKLTEGTANYLFTKRNGSSAIGMLRPIASV